MQINEICDIIIDKSKPIIATAIHDGHELCDYLKSNTKLSDLERLREEDPFTGILAKVSDTYIIAKNSRFEVDLNRPREKAIYKKPSDAWGLDMWKNSLTKKHIEQTLTNQYDLFYDNLKEILDDYLKTHKKIIVLDIHSYNHRRGGEKAPFDSNLENPEIIVGTGTLKNRKPWANTIDSVIESLSSNEVMGRYLDVRENVKFKGGEMGRWIHKNYPNSVLCLSIEFKKIFMNEWSGKEEKVYIGQIKDLISKTISDLELFSFVSEPHTAHYIRKSKSP